MVLGPGVGSEVRGRMGDGDVGRAVRTVVQVGDIAASVGVMLGVCDTGYVENDMRGESVVGLREAYDEVRTQQWLDLRRDDGTPRWYGGTGG